MSAYLFDAPARDDGFRELSVSWMDNPEAIGILLDMSYKGRSIFVAGIGVLERSRIDELKNRYSGRIILDYERSRSRRNPYHGNILIGKCSITEVRMLASKLARSAKHYPRCARIPFDDGEDS